MIDIERLVENIKYNKKYLYCDNSLKFIYSKYNSKHIVGMNTLLFNKVIEVKSEKFDEGKWIARVDCENEKVGWLHLENTLRLYRLYSINGKILSTADLKFNGKDYSQELEGFKNRVLKAYYYFEYENEAYLLVGRVGDNELIPIKRNQFKELIFVKNPIKINIKEGTPLYGSSNFQKKISEIGEDSELNIISYYEGTRDIKISFKNEKYWTKSEKFLPKEEDNFSIENLELMDLITYLNKRSSLIKSQNRSLNNTIKEIGKRAVINNEEDTLFFEKYVGDSNDFK